MTIGQQLETLEKTRRFITGVHAASLQRLLVCGVQGARAREPSGRGGRRRLHAAGTDEGRQARARNALPVMPLCLMIIRFCGRFEGKEALLAWTNNVLDESLSWEDVSDGVVFCRLLDRLLHSAFPLHTVFSVRPGSATSSVQSHCSSPCLHSFESPSTPRSAPSSAPHAHVDGSMCMQSVQRDWLVHHNYRQLQSVLLHHTRFKMDSLRLARGDSVALLKLLQWLRAAFEGCAQAAGTLGGWIYDPSMPYDAATRKALVRVCCAAPAFLVSPSLTLLSCDPELSIDPEVKPTLDWKLPHRGDHGLKAAGGEAYLAACEQEEEEGARTLQRHSAGALRVVSLVLGGILAAVLSASLLAAILLVCALLRLCHTARSRIPLLV